MHEESSQRWARIDELFAAALTHPPADRDAFLRTACGGDNALEREVAALLRSLTDAEAAIGESAGALFEISGPLVDAPDAALPNGARVGAYEIRRLLGRGGMGNVYAAVRADGTVAREVAVKVVRTGMHGDHLARRLRQEQRILGALEHPRIARLYDSGVTPDGAPFLVMELVQGTRIDTHVVSSRLAVPERLRLFEEVCEAVAFAHQRLVVHRDLKPANVFVAADGHVRLLDFGIARLLADDASDASTPAEEGHGEGTTRPGQLVLTPEYAAPEQARGEPAGVSMDVYALGVMLHELLVGSRPAWQRLVMTRGDDAAIERAMVPPSRNATDPDTARRLRGDLDRVILTALSPDRARRYPSVEALRDDVRRVREGYPILARRASVAERMVRYVRRNPRLALAWGVAAVATLAFTTNSVVQERRVALERDRASAERDAATLARDRASRERDRARATNQLLASLFERADPLAPGRGDTLRVTQVLSEGIERVNRDLADQPAARAALLSALGRAYLGLGQYAEAQSLLDTARALQADDPDVSAEERGATLMALGNLARRRGRHDAADSMFRETLALREGKRDLPVERGAGTGTRETGAPETGATVTRAPDAATTAPGPSTVSPTPTPVVARSAMPAATASPSTPRVPLRSDLERDSTAPRGIAVALVSLGAGHMERNRFDSARVYFDSAYAVLQALPRPDSTALADYLNNRATLAMRTGDVATAASLSGAALAIHVARLGSDHPRVAVEKANLGFLLDRTGRSVEAETLLRDALRILREQMPADHPMVRSAKLTLGGILSRTGRLGDAERMIAEVVTADRAAGEDAQRGLPVTLDNYAGVLEKLGRTGEAWATYREAFELQRATGGDDHPGTAILRAKVADLSCRIDGASPAVLAEFGQSLGVLDRVFPPTHPFRLGGRGQYGACLVRAGRRSDGERELLAVFDGARRAPASAHSVARIVGKELLALYATPADSARRTLVQAQLDSLGSAGSGGR